MISRQLEPINLLFGISMEEAAQALAFSYLAYDSSSDAMLPRVLQSYQRAWGCDFILQCARKDNGTPGFVVALWNTDGLQRMLIAIEGTTTSSQIVNLSSTLGWTARDGFLGYTMSNFKSKADDIYAQIAANTTANAAFTNPRTIVTWAGHSMGAACADICAVRQKYSQPRMHVRLIKFGAPRVGNDVYVNNYANLLPRASYYCHRDPCFLVPTSEIRLITGLGLLLDSGPVAEANCTRLTYFSPRIELGFYRHDLTYTRMHVYRDGSRTMDLANPWYDHLIGSYRLSMMIWASAHRDLTFYRFNYLEHRTENIWQVRGNSGLIDWPNWSVVNDALNIQQPPPSAAADALANAPGIADGGGEWGGASVPAAGLNEDPVPVLAPIPSVTADFGTPVTPAQVIQLRTRTLRHDAS